MIMRATLHDHVPNTYYGQWPGKKALFAGLESQAIAHNELAASAGFGAFARRRVGNLRVDQKEKSARLAKGRASGDNHATHRFHLKQQRSTARARRSRPRA